MSTLNRPERDFISIKSYPPIREVLERENRRVNNDLYRFLERVQSNSG